MIDLLRMLAGEWRGKGFGEYPTIVSFDYLETLQYTLDEVRPLLSYVQNTRRFKNEVGDYVPSHWETGYLHWLGDGKVQIANAQLGGRVEVMEGTIEATDNGFVMKLRSIDFANDSRMADAARTFSLEGDTLHYRMSMQTTKVPDLTLHVEATLHRE